MKKQYYNPVRFQLKDRKDIQTILELEIYKVIKFKSKVHLGEENL